MSDARPNGWIEVRIPREAQGVTHITAICRRCGDRESLALDLTKDDGDVIAIVQSFEKRHVACPQKGVAQA